MPSLHSDSDPYPSPLWTDLRVLSADTVWLWSSEDACGIDHGDPEWHVL